jgi:hypothetical protein
MGIPDQTARTRISTSNWNLLDVAPRLMVSGKGYNRNPDWESESHFPQEAQTQKLEN